MKRVRFAPSPTGTLHIGTLRTALFNWLYAKSQNGVFVLRIEDTDLERSKKEYETNIYEGLKALNITIDEGPEQGGDYGPYRQSERIKKGIYQGYAEELLQKGHAYHCFCSDEDLDKEREAANKAKKPYVYTRKCVGLTEKEINAKKESGTPFTLRFKMPESGAILIQDKIRGEVKFECNLISDFVIMKSDGSASYNFAVVVDDKDMAITHVIRGEDHISNTAKQIAIFDALNAPRPIFAHLPMILGPDKAKLSKRHGATSVTEYKELGFYPDALFNYLCLLGWSPGNEQEIFTREEIISQFSLERINKSGAIFDTEKLTWMNGQYIRKLSPEKLYEVVEPFISSEVKKALNVYSKEKKIEIVVSVQGNLELLADINGVLKIYIQTESDYQNQLAQLSFSETDLSVITQFLAILKETSQPLSKVWFQETLELLGKTTSLGKGKILKPLRLALTAEKSGPNIGEIMGVFGREKVFERLGIVQRVTSEKG